MINIYKLRFYLFLFGCIGVRLLFTILSAFSSGWVLIVFGIIALIPVYRWFYIIFLSDGNTGIDALDIFGNVIWWKLLRPVHMILWAFFAYLAIMGNKYAWIVLLVDTIFGGAAFFINHWKEGTLVEMIS
jgi:hypothetical protein